MEGAIYLIGEDNQLQEMKGAQYDAEKTLQDLLVKYPNLLAGDQMNDAAPRRWLLISTEVPVAGEDAGVGRVDHLFLDQDGIPTLIEVKRSSDTRIRREVVGQMLDYAANAVAYWPEEEIRAHFEAQCENCDQDPEQVLAEFLGTDADSDKFWQDVKTNLQAGRIRMVFVADVIPSELRRVVEFLNNQMELAEVLAVEIRQYVGQSGKVLVPRVLGRTAGRIIPRQRKTDREAFLAACDEAGRPVFDAILNLADSPELVHWGKEGFSLNVSFGRTNIPLCFGYPPPSGFHQSLYTGFYYIRKKVKEGDSLVDEFRRRLQQTGLFIQAGGGDEMKLVLQKELPEKQIEQVTGILQDLAAAIRQHGLADSLSKA